MSHQTRIAPWAVLSLSFGAPVVGQTRSFGVIGGVAPTADYRSTAYIFTFPDSIRNLDGTLTTSMQTFTGKRWTPVVGAKVELALPGNWSIEADLLRTEY